MRKSSFLGLCVFLVFHVFSGVSLAANYDLFLSRLSSISMDQEGKEADAIARLNRVYQQYLAKLMPEVGSDDPQEKVLRAYVANLGVEYSSSLIYKIFEALLVDFENHAGPNGELTPKADKSWDLTHDVMGLIFFYSDFHRTHLIKPAVYGGDMQHEEAKKAWRERFDVKGIDEGVTVAFKELPDPTDVTDLHSVGTLRRHIFQILSFDGQADNHRACQARLELSEKLRDQLSRSNRKLRAFVYRVAKEKRSQYRVRSITPFNGFPYRLDQINSFPFPGGFYDSRILQPFVHYLHILVQSCILTQLQQQPDLLKDARSALNGGNWDHIDCEGNWSGADKADTKFELCSGELPNVDASSPLFIEKTWLQYALGKPFMH